MTDAPLDAAELRLMANAVRILSIDAVEAAKSGHQGLPLGMADVAATLFRRHLKFDPRDPKWPDRDRFVLSAGHGSMLLYSILHLTGHQDFPLETLRRFRQWGSYAAGHPEYGHGAGVETTTGPLGQGIATAVGLALAERMLAARFGDDLVDHRTWVIASDGDLMEGVSQEAIGIAGHLRLSRLIVLFDDNGITIDGRVDLADSTDQMKRFEASGWATRAVDGHDVAAVDAALDWAKGQDRPVLIACRTTIGFGAPTVAGTNKAHGYAITGEGVAKAREALGWTHAPFEIPEEARAGWAEAGRRGGAARAAWADRLASSESRAAFEAAIAGDVSATVAAALRGHIDALIAKPQDLATRNASELALAAINAAVAETVGGSADLTGSNNTLTKGMKPIAPGDFAGRFVHWGIREHGMAAAMNGMALHGGVIPYSGTFLVFSDYARPAIRLAALMGVRVVHVMTHDSIGLGEDGPTHQPVEHLASLRALPNCHVFRPADAVETAECWELALARANGPSVLALTRQKTAQVRRAPSGENLCARGAYELRAAEGAAKVTLIATGSEVEIAVAAREILQAQGIGTRVVSLPCFELFAEQDAAYRREVLGPGTVRVGVEAAVRFGWDAILGADGGFVGMQGFGASAPYQELYARFGITAEAVAAKAKASLEP